MNTLSCLRNCFGVAMAFAVSASHASLIVSPHGATRDADLAGAAAAIPDDAGSAQLTNPAGVVGPLSRQIVGGVAVINFTSHYKDPRRGFDQTSSQTPLFLNLSYGFGEFAGWSFAAGLYGSVGTAFDFAPDGMQEGPGGQPTPQESPFIGKLSIANIGLFAGRQLTPRLRVGLQVAPSFGTQSVALPTPFGDADFDGLSGFGIDGSIGLAYDLSERLSLGLAYRTRGYNSLDGDGRVGDEQQELELTLYTPQSITGGLAYEAVPGLTAFAQTRWTRYSDFERGRFEFGETSELDQAYIADAKNRFRYWFALEYEGLPNQTIRAGYTYESWMIEPSAMRPTLFDVPDSMFMIGYEVQQEHFNIGFTYGYTSGRERFIPESENPDFSGFYNMNIRTGFGVHLTWNM